MNLFCVQFKKSISSPYLFLSRGNFKRQKESETECASVNYNFMSIIDMLLESFSIVVKFLFISIKILIG